MKFEKCAAINLTLPKDYNFEASVNKPSHFQSELVKYDDGVLHQTLRIGEKVVGIAWNNDIVDVYSDTTINSSEKDIIKEEIIFRYDIDGEITNFLQQYKDDPVLSGPIERLWGMHPTCTYSLYEFLMVTTMLQNTSVRRSAQMTDVMLNAYGEHIEFNGQKIGVIWTPDVINKVSESDLRELRIGYRAKNIKKISAEFDGSGIIESELRELPTDELRERLLGIYGVGPQTVNYLIFEYFHRYDALNHLSPWESKLISKVIFDNKDHSGDTIVKYLKEKYTGYEALSVLLWRICFIEEKTSKSTGLKKRLGRDIDNLTKN